MPVLEDVVRDHYGTLAVADRISAALAALKAAKATLTPDDLAAFDQLHTGGAVATRSVIDRFAPARDSHVIDVGSGLGGPARMLAAVAGVRVTGIDLTPAFVATANRLTLETAQTDRVAFQCASALALPFGDQTFDAAWHIHMSMNIADKALLYGEIFRVLKPGARFALYDPIRGAHGEVIFPVPWAETAVSSHLGNRAEMLGYLHAAGFAAIDAFDGTDDARAWFARLAAAEAAATPEAKARAAARTDPRLAVAAANHRVNLENGAVEILGVVARKPL